MKPILAVLTLLLLGCVSSATTITEPGSYTITAHSTSGPARTITFTFTSDLAPSPTSDTIKVTHTGLANTCAPDGTTSLPEGGAETAFSFGPCAGFAFGPPGVFVVEFLDPGGATSDGAFFANSGALGAQGSFASVSAVAEPAGLAVLGSGLLILGGLLRRRARKATRESS
jgi:hypothetical protein